MLSNNAMEQERRVYFNEIDKMGGGPVGGSAVKPAVAAPVVKKA